MTALAPPVMRVPGPIGARCGDCVHGPRNGERIWFCHQTWAIVSSAERACYSFVPTNGQLLDPVFPHQRREG
jgi:hypothetical protein